MKQDKTDVRPIFQGLTSVISLINCQRQDYIWFVSNNNIQNVVFCVNIKRNIGDTIYQNLEIIIGKIRLNKERKFCIMEFNVRNILIKIRRDKKNGEDKTDDECI